MRYNIFFFILVTVLLQACKKKGIPSNSDLPKDQKIYSFQDATKFQSEAMSAYNSRPKEAAHLFLKASEAYRQNKYTKDVGVCLSNAAHLYEEFLFKNDSALILSQLGLNASIEAKDSLSIAHGYRYTGYLMGLNGKAQEGITLLEKSYPIYRSRRNFDAVAVADYDIARLHFILKNYKIAEEKLKASTDYFKTKVVVQRIFLNNIFAIELAKVTGNKNLIALAKNENTEMLSTGKISDVLKQKFLDALK